MSDGTFLQPVRPSLARVLAGAASAAFIGAPGSTFYIVCRYQDANQGVSPANVSLDPYNVQPPFDSYAAAFAAMTRLNGTPSTDEYGLFGPFEYTHSDISPPPDQATVSFFQVYPVGGQAPAGDNFQLSGTDYDAMFWSIEAVAKFVVPYYVQEYGPEFGKNVMDMFNAAPLALVVHMPWSEYDEVGLTGGVTARMSDTAPGGTGSTSDGGSGKLSIPQPQPAPEKKWIPVFFDRDECGRVQRRPVYPPRSQS